MAPPSFDASTLEVWGPLLNGGCCTVLPAGIPSLSTLGDAIRRERITVLWLTSSLFNAIIDDEPEMLRGVRLVMTGGEALSSPHVRKAAGLLPETRLLNGYGPTENTTFTTCWEIPRDLPETWGSVPIGRPIAGTRVYVLDAARRLAPAGVPGELHAAGEGVALGYVGLPELTAERFVPDPFAEEPGRRMYRTGDIVRWLDSGVLEFLGRTDDQVKIRGHRVEPGELEAALQAHPAVRQACVAVGEDEAAGKFLLAYYTVGRPVPRAELRRFLEARLPQFLLPRELVEVAAMPLLPSGKVDRGALAALWSSRRAAPESAGLDAPRPGMEEQVAAIWRRLLGRKIISRSDDFFEIGGNSLAARRHVGMMR
jgi:acyl-coenzyme A synthetase/AMP-(fatty) acid ligase